MKKSIGTGLGLLIATLALTGMTAAQPLTGALSGDGGGEAAGEAEGEYYVNASGAMDAADEHHEEAESTANSEVRNTNEAVTEAQWDAYERVDETERPEADPEPPELENEIKRTGNAQAQHTDRVEKAADADTEYVDAGADLSFSAKAKAWVSDAFNGVADVYEDARGLLETETTADEDAKGNVENGLEAENELRNDVVSQAELDNEVPDADPSVNGEATAEHATEVATDAAGQGQAEIP